MILTINDDFDLKKIADSGQCFRVREFPDGMFRFVTGDNVLYIRRLLLQDDCCKCDDTAFTFEVSCDEATWEKVWKYYFDLNRSYRGIRESIKESDPYMQKAAECGCGIRILCQDPFEMLLSFIISQRKSIPAIKSSVEMICEHYGRPVKTDYETVYTFPTADQIIYKSTEYLKECKLGYRLDYILQAVKRVHEGEVCLEELRDIDSELLLERLKDFYGVGDKVANCIALFAYGRCELAPIDTWIKKVIENVYSGYNPFPDYLDNAGIMQQYIFYYCQTHKDEFD